ncbi:MAG: DUF3781 domain-containing protein [Lentilactobacillus diolivorans]|uniref:DUF3781 domain-containing protein n=1 Tax=Lentilactobacillus diolivorans TaxID=179838 RepID=UPI0039EA67BD
MTEQQVIANQLCYTELVYQRINKKLIMNLTKVQIERFIYHVVVNADLVEQRGKNFYIYNNQNRIIVTVNANNYRVITVSKM